MHAELTRDLPCACCSAVAVDSVAANGPTPGYVDGGPGRDEDHRGGAPVSLRPMMREFVTVGVEEACIGEADTGVALIFIQEDRPSSNSRSCPWGVGKGTISKRGIGRGGRPP
ncbi:hypothetical protein H4582DRAFT_2056343 [Lactarius indigo]|nr:hypothetical protein H4582DRAFT_2056343 [Lactarius indigo]